MVSITTSFRQLFGGTTAVCECRNCGTTVEDPEATCPTCGSEEIAVYDLEA